MPNSPAGDTHQAAAPPTVLAQPPVRVAAALPTSPPQGARRLRHAWWLVPALAAAAYAPVLALWFALDDFILLDYNKFLRWPSALFHFGPDSLFYRPFSITLIWNAGEALFGANALPYHLISLGLHALAAWLLGRAVAVIAGEDRSGWLAGGLFAVYPLNTEAVGWLAAQWDLWAAVCGLAALWGFAQGWRAHDRRAYALGFGAMALAVGMKESILLLPVLLPLVAVVTSVSPAADRPRDRRDWIALLSRALRWSLPYAVPTLAFIALRVSARGSLGGYPGQRTDYGAFFWDTLVAAGQELVMPLNRSVFPAPLVQIGGFLVAAGLLVGLALWARRRGPLLFLAGAWVLVFLAPVLNLIPLSNPEHLGNRIFYIASMGYCLALAVLAGGALDRLWAGRWRGVIALGALLLIIPITWVQLGPWVQSARQERALLAEIDGIMVPTAQKVQLNIQGLPEWYKGAYLFGGGLNPALDRFTRQETHVTSVAALDPDQLNTRFVWPGLGGVYNLAITLDPANQLYEVSQLDGVTTGAAPPDGGRVWDYTACTPATLGAWQPVNARFGCAPRSRDPLPGAASYAVFTPQSADSQLTMPEAALDLRDQRLVRLAVCVRLSNLGASRQAEWFWSSAAGAGWTPKQSRTVLLQSNAAWRVYWTYLPVAQLGPALRGLRLDPVNTTDEVDIAWIAVTPLR